MKEDQTRSRGEDERPDLGLGEAPRPDDDVVERALSILRPRSRVFPREKKRKKKGRDGGPSCVSRPLARGPTPAERRNTNFDALPHGRVLSLRLVSSAREPGRVLSFSLPLSFSFSPSSDAQRRVNRGRK